MKRIAVLGAVLTIGLIVQATGASSLDPPRVLGFQTLVGVQGPFVGEANPIRDVVGGGLPWQIDVGRGRLLADGRLRVHVEGLVLLDDPSVPEAVRGTNPVPSFKAILSCLSFSGSATTTANLSTRLFPATATGDATIHGRFALPSPCIAPIVFVTSPTGAWFASTGI